MTIVSNKEPLVKERVKEIMPHCVVFAFMITVRSQILQNVIVIGSDWNEGNDQVTFD